METLTLEQTKKKAGNAYLKRALPLTFLFGALLSFVASIPLIFDIAQTELVKGIIVAGILAVVLAAVVVVFGQGRKAAIKVAEENGFTLTWDR